MRLRRQALCLRVTVALLISSWVYLDRRRWRPDGVTIVGASSLLHLPYGVQEHGGPNATMDELIADLRTITSMPSASCTIDSSHRSRYAHPRQTITVAANLYQSEAVLPTFIAELTTLADLVDLHVVIVENGSTDETPRLLGLLARMLDVSGATYAIFSEGDDESGGYWSNRRIQMLVRKRNQLVELIVQRQADHVVFLNDVFFCAADVLELVYQRATLGAGLVAGLDYTFPRDYLAFRDHWVARDMNGDALAPIENGSGFGQPNFPPHPLFRDNADAYRRANELIPIQVFSSYVDPCLSLIIRWNGIAAVDPDIFQPPLSIRTRTVTDGSDLQSECYLLCVDMWKAGRGRIAIAPRVKVAYHLGVHHIIRQQWSNISIFSDQSEAINWIDEPPALVRKFPQGRWSKAYWSHPFDD